MRVCVIHCSLILSDLQVDIVETDMKLEDKLTISKESLVQEAQKIMLADKDMIEKSKRGFISFIRSYKEHDVRSIKITLRESTHSSLRYTIPIGQIISSQQHLLMRECVVCDNSSPNI